jgi:hypothetical protein
VTKKVWLGPPLPQDPDPRIFAKGDRVRAYCTFSNGCPPGPERIARGTLGTVMDTPWFVPDYPFREKIRIVPVQWDTGKTSRVVDSLLEKEI